MLLRALPAPEGIRQAVLFTYAKGKLLSWNERHSYLLGRTVAEIHNAAADFHSSHRRFRLDLDHLINKPLATIQPFLQHRAGDWGYLQRVADRLRECLTHLATEGLAWGVCHGDLYPDNAHIADDDTVTVFDFDCGGPGWWAYDLAGFRHEGALASQGDDVWEAFFKGYTEQRGVTELDLQAIPMLVAARQVWPMGMQTGNVEHLGSAWIAGAYWDRMMKLLRELVAKYGDGKERLKGDIIL
jgi:Ser/Thr protein kinase RdoA (MazF antagonist)